MSFSALAVDVLHPSICFSHIKNGHEGDAFTLHDESQILSFIEKNGYEGDAFTLHDESQTLSFMKKSALRPQLGGSDGARSYEVGEKRR